MTAAPSRRWLRRGLIALAILLLLPLGGLAAFLLTFDPNAWKPRIEAAAQAATGRALTIAGPVAAKLSLRPTITLEEVAFANPPGFSRPAMLQARRVEVQLAVLPLLARRVELHRVALDGADLLLERDAQGLPNWVLARPAAPGAAAPATPAAPAPRPFALSVDSLLLTEAAIGWRGGPGEPVRALALQRLAAEAQGIPGGPGEGLRVSGALALGDLPLALEGETGPPAALLAPNPANKPGTTPWPLRLSLSGEGGLALRIEGQVAEPAQRRGWRLALAAWVPDLARLAPLLPDVSLPPLRGVEATAVLSDAGGAPALSDLRLVVGESPLGLLHPALVLDRARLALPAPDRPLVLEAAARLGALPLALSGTLGPPARLLAAAGAPWPVDLRAEAGAARLTLAGTVADPRAGTGIDLALAAGTPDLAALAPLLPGAPPLRDVSLQARLAGRGARFAEGVELRDLRLLSSAGDLAGALTLATRPRLAVSGALASARLDLDALRPAPDVAPPPAAASPEAAPAPAPAPAAADRRVIPDIALPLEALRLAEADLRLSVQALRAAGLDWQGVAAHLLAREGRARLDPLEARLAGAGRIALRAAADITTDPATVQVALRTGGLELAAIPAAGGATGRLTLEAELRGRGRDLRRLAAGAFGHLGLTLQEGSLPPRLLGEALAGLGQRVPGVAELAARPLALSCVAARLEVQEGIARPRVLLAETGLGRLGAGEGAGAISLRDETLALRLNTDLRLPVPGLGAGGLRVRAPVPVTGTLAAPRPEWNAVIGSALAGEVANQAERALGGAAGQLLGALGGAVAGSRDPAGGAIPDCAAALAAARGGAAPAAAAVPAPGPSHEPSPGQAPPPAPLRDLPRELPGAAQELLRRLPLPGLPGR